MVKIRIITPLCSMSEQMTEDTMAEVRPLEKLGISFDNVTIGSGPSSIESHFDEAFSAPFVAIEAMKAERDGIDGVIIDCMGDPGMMAAREAVSIPVVGPGEAAMHMASMMGHKFSCISITDSVRPIFFAHARVYGIAEKLASVRIINMPLQLIEESPEKTFEALYAEAVKAIRQDYADTLILGCTGFVGVAQRLQDKIKRELGMAVPVINPLPTAALMAVMMVQGGLPHSPQAYHKPNLKKKFPGFDIPGRGV
jgi:allantoin racemase